MPFVTAATIAAVAAACGRLAQPVVPAYGAKRGHPLGFPSSMAVPLVRARPTSTLKAELAALGGAPISVPVDDPGVLRDVDVPADLSR